jgi:hypothetical protein
MKRRGLQIGLGAISILFMDSCRRQPQSVNVSDDQMNHFAGIQKHDHPVPVDDADTKRSSSPQSAGEGGTKQP